MGSFSLSLVFINIYSDGISTSMSKTASILYNKENGLTYLEEQMEVR